LQELHCRVRLPCRHTRDAGAVRRGQVQQRAGQVVMHQLRRGLRLPGGLDVADRLWSVWRGEVQSAGRLVQQLLCWIRVSCGLYTAEPAVSAVSRW
jgi:hypothetical protein